MLIFGDPCGQFYATNTQGSQNFWQTLTATVATSGLPSGMLGPTALIMGPRSGKITVPQTGGPYIIGFRVNFASVSGEQEILAFLDPTGGTQTSFFTEANGTITAWRAGGTKIATTSNAVTIAAGVTCYIEVQLSVDASVGIVGVRINGVSVLQTTANTKGSSSANIGAIAIGSNLTPYVQDVLITDATGTYNNTYLGDCHLSVYNALTAGTPAINQYTPNGAGTIPLCVSATTPADGSIFASDATPGDRMSVGVANTAVTGSIAALIHISRVKKDAAGTRTFAQTITSNGVDATGPTQAPGTSFAYYAQISETDPNTGLPYTQGAFNAPLQCGLKTIA